MPWDASVPHGHPGPPGDDLASPGDHWAANIHAEGALSGSAEELAAALRAYAAAGIAHVQVWLDPNTVAGAEAFAPVLALLDDA